MARKAIATLGQRRRDDLRQDLHFIKAMLANPAKTGAIKPTSPIAAGKMASIIPTGFGGNVLELGPGTGAVTKAILERGIAPERLYAIEHNQLFFEALGRELPKIRLIHGDAFDLSATLKRAGAGDIEFAATISVLPLLLFEKSACACLIRDCLEKMPDGAPFVQLSYGLLPPVQPVHGRFTVEKLDSVLRNVPPAKLWIYRKSDN